MISDHEIQEDMITLLQGEATVTDLLHSAEEVREHQYMGKAYRAPALRIHIAANVPHIPRQQCDHSTVNFSVLCYTEEDSSKRVRILAKAVNNFLHRKDISGNGYHAWVYSTGLGTPEVVGSEPTLWRVTCAYFMNVYPS